MGHITPQESLVLRWAELCNDPHWHNVPGKIELNGYGVIEVSPASNIHAFAQGAIANSLGQQLPLGHVLVECSVFTTDGVRVPDVAWVSHEFAALHGRTTPFTMAPEICVEVRSPSNTDAEMALKTRLFLEAGALEVWIVADTGEWQIFDAQGQQPVSRFGVQLTRTALR